MQASDERKAPENVLFGVISQDHCQRIGDETINISVNDALRASASSQAWINNLSCKLNLFGITFCTWEWLFSHSFSEQKFFLSGGDWLMMQAYECKKTQTSSVY